MGCYQDSSSVQRIPGEFVHFSFAYLCQKVAGFLASIVWVRMLNSTCLFLVHCGVEF